MSSPAERYIADQLNRIERKLDIIIWKERNIVTLLDDVQAAEDKALAAIQANTNALGAVADAIRNKDAQIADLTAQLATAIANGAPADVLQAIVDKGNAIVAASDAQATAEAALIGTPPASIQDAPPPTEPAPAT